jgi:hypothetical protein
MADENVTPLRPNQLAPSQRARKRARTAPRFILTEIPEETPHRVACVLRFLSEHHPDRGSTNADADDVEFGLFILLRDLATALDTVRGESRG